MTIAEVTLSDRYQAGVQWSKLTGEHLTALFNPLGANLTNPPSFALSYTGNVGGDPLTVTLKALETFGDVSVLLSPRIMTLNNQPAVLRVADERVYVITDVETIENREINETRRIFTVDVNTVPEGVVLSVTPFVDENDVVTLNIRPTITRVLDFIEFSNPTLNDAGVVNRIPELQVREMETLLRVSSGNAAVIGGLMQDRVNKSREGLPLIGNTPLIGDLFSYRDETHAKTELVLFIRPLVVADASLRGDFAKYRNYIPNFMQTHKSGTGTY